MSDFIDYEPCSPLLEKVLRIGPCYVVGHQAVSEAALQEAGYTLAKMLDQRPDVSENFRAHGAITAVFGRHESVYDLEYFSDLTEKPTAEGGLGGTVAQPVTACSERNLLKLDNDPYHRFDPDCGANVSVHELAHTILNIGLMQREIAQVKWRHSKAIRAGLWSGTWASRNYQEFFAELSQIYFSCQCSCVTDFHMGINGPAALENYDRESFKLMKQIYRGTHDLK